MSKRWTYAYPSSPVYASYDCSILLPQLLVHKQKRELKFGRGSKKTRVDPSTPETYGRSWWLISIVLSMSCKQTKTEKMGSVRWLHATRLSSQWLQLSIASRPNSGVARLWGPWFNSNLELGALPFPPIHSPSLLSPSPFPSSPAQPLPGLPLPRNGPPNVARGSEGAL